MTKIIVFPNVVTMHKDLIKSSWADEVEDHLEKTTLPPSKTEQIGNSRVITEYRWNKDDKKEKVVRTYKIEKRLVSKTIAERKTWPKFGDSRNDKPGPNIATTIPAEEIQMQFLTGKDDDKAEENPLDKLKNVNMNIKCRTCGGEHWSFSCHLKGTGLVLEDKKLVPEKLVEPEKTAGGTNRLNFNLSNTSVLCEYHFIIFLDLIYHLQHEKELPIQQVDEILIRVVMMKYLLFVLKTCLKVHLKPT